MHCRVDAPKDSLSCRGVRRVPPAFSLECLVFHAQVDHPIVTSMQKSSMGEPTRGPRGLVA